MRGTGSPRVAGRPERQETLLPGRDRFTGRNPDQAGQVDLTVKNMLTRLTRHGLAARLGCDCCNWMLVGLCIMFSASTIPGVTMPYAPSVGNELSTARASANPPISTLGGLATQHGYSGGLDVPSQHQCIAWILPHRHFPVYRIRLVGCFLR